MFALKTLDKSKFVFQHRYNQLTTYDESGCEEITEAIVYEVDSIPIFDQNKTLKNTLKLNEKIKFNK